MGLPEASNNITSFYGSSCANNGKDAHTQHPRLSEAAIISAGCYWDCCYLLWQPCQREDSALSNASDQEQCRASGEQARALAAADMDESMLESTAMELDPSLLLQATPEPEVLMHEDREAGTSGRGMGNWLDQVQGVVEAWLEGVDSYGLRAWIHMAGTLNPKP
eukprot:661966-Prorocentrum_minimum.AAC.2